jgi:TRAP-type uncharacterized transport system substrate-binding protein
LLSGAPLEKPTKATNTAVPAAIIHWTTCIEYEIGRQYQALLARAGVALRLVATAGTVENLPLLRDPHSGVDIALMQGGSVGKERAG